MEKCALAALTQKVLKVVRKSLEYAHWDMKIYRISSDTLKNSTNVTLLIVILIFQVGTWNEKTGVNFTRNFTESYTEIVESLQNKTLIVTTIYVSWNKKSLLVRLRPTHHHILHEEKFFLESLSKNDLPENITYLHSFYFLLDFMNAQKLRVLIRH